MKKISLLLLSLFALPASVYADSNDDLAAARDAWRAGDIAQLQTLAASSARTPLGMYPRYWLALKSLENGDEAPARAFLAQEAPSTLTERLANEWLKRLGKGNNWDGFRRELVRAPEDARDQETQCYAALSELKAGRISAPDADLLDKLTLPEGCNSLLNESATLGTLSQDEVRSRVRTLVANNYVTVARALATSAGLSDEFFTPGSNEAAVIAIVRRGKSDLSGAAADLARIEPTLTREQVGFGWGELATRAARRQDMTQALDWYAKSAPGELTPEQWEWWARAALREQNWNTLSSVIGKMPAKLAARQAWRYWLSQAELMQGKRSEANARLVRLSQEHSYYGILAREALGNSLSEPARQIEASDKDMRAISKEPAIARAIELFALSDTLKRPEFHEEARREWRWAMRGKTDPELIAAAELAKDKGFYDMAIYSAERTRDAHNFGLRFLAPYRSTTERYARQLDVDPAWIYGLMRQESRFTVVARSGVGASGLMQLMPATARWVANKVGLPGFDVNDVDTNIQLGTWYLRHVLDTTGHPVLATAGYNAGPGRARAWRASTPLDGTIYTETIPFTETRDYVQKVMANATYYAASFGKGETSLKARMGTIAAK
ncbi:lytic transglycosylase domain-containing protein [Craterilacuibacter sinensis]|uniref:Transglycosylase SLT domain-containing protein n=1 Tax=Craterilacuibacter sinensis TaxID=2686017 RepID=A0A845BR92_9NEIS|nr:lytic transglycosylase domain-containing protein [Craterilacuibacter sinensis]MXR37001.1 transglycosylase SLT domain-containing protein [Craterilacuibacter sinensis]